jgi:hypothetical protein
MNANVQVYFKDILAGNAVTDPDGNFVVKPLNSGYYNACIIAPGYNKHLITQVAIEEQDSNKIHITLTRHKNSKPETVVTAYKKPFISADKPERILTKGEIAVIPTGGIQVDLVYISNVVYQTKRGDTVVLSKPDSAPPKTPANEPLNPSRKVYKGEDIDRLPH